MASELRWSNPGNDEMLNQPGRDTVLVVDDEEPLREVLQRMLEEEGCGVLTAADGTEGLRILESHPDSISVVILDWMMPQMTGIELLRWMKKQRHIEHIPVIMLTALDDPERIKEGIDAGAFYYLIKPFQRPLLNSILRAAVADYHAFRHLLETLKQYKRPIALLEEGTFRFRTPQEAEQVAVMIASATPDPEHAMVIAELLLNAVEHGNLGISYLEKGKLLEDNAWELEVTRRLALPENANRHVEVKVRRVNGSMEVEIQDQGPGFDYQRYLTIDESRLFDNHGRGIAIARSALNVEFVGTGNTVRVTIPVE
ncbi:MAG TPA: response regulator [Bacteroidota bacterium]|nr:response regulator [Bacteroidota bacterium]